MEIGIRHELRGVETIRAGCLLLPAQQLTQILRESRAEHVELEATGNESTTVRCGSGQFELPQRPVDEFPELPEGGDSPWTEGPAGILRTLIRRTLFAADRRETTGRYSFKGLYWEPLPESSRLRLVASDGKRLAVSEAAMVITPAQNGTLFHPLVPLRAISLLERNLTHEGEVVRCYLGNNEVRFLTERATIYSTLVEGQFPPYRNILEKAEKAGKIKIALPVEEFLAAVRQIRVMTDEESKRVDITFRSGQAVLAARGAATGSGRVELSLPDFAGPDIRIAFDPDYLVEYLNVARHEPAAADQGIALTLELSSSDRPALFRCGTDWLYLVMPMVEV
jgi:DNA polymerase-3 subunit beta